MHAYNSCCVSTRQFDTPFPKFVILPMTATIPSPAKMSLQRIQRGVMWKTWSWIPIVDLVHSCARGHVIGEAIHDPGSIAVSPVKDGVDPSPERQPPKDNPAACERAKAYRHSSFSIPLLHLRKVSACARCKGNRQHSDALSAPTPAMRRVQDLRGRPLHFDTRIRERPGSKKTIITIITTTKTTTTATTTT